MKSWLNRKAAVKAGAVLAACAILSAWAHGGEDVPATQSGVVSTSSAASAPTSGNEVEALKRRIGELEERIRQLQEIKEYLEKENRAHLDSMLENREHRITVAIAIMRGMKNTYPNALSYDQLDWLAGDFGAATMAKADLARGRLVILTGGLNVFSEERKQMLLKKYNVSVLDIAPCTGGQAIFKLIDGYNQVSEAAMKAKHGEDFMKKAFAEADAAPTSRAVETQRR